MDKLISIELAHLEADPDQPRKDFDPERLQELANSIKAVGLKTPISVRRHPTKKDFFMIIAGERRFRASGMLGLTHIDAIVVESEDALTQESIYAHQLTENLHRQDLNPVEKAEFIQNRIDYLKNRKGIAQAGAKVAEELGVSRSWISKNTAILKFVPEVRNIARDGKVKDYTLLNKINKLSPDKRNKALELIADGNFNSKEFFARKRYDSKPSSNDGDSSVDENITQVEPPIRLVFSTSECAKLIERTDFKSVLDKHEPDWRNSDRPVMQSYITKFKEWLVDCPS